MKRERKGRGRKEGKGEGCVMALGDGRPWMEHIIVRQMTQNIFMWLIKK